jgi:hypothetical protein
MTDSAYRLLAVEFVREIQGLLIHPGSRQALELASSWAQNEIPKDSAIAAAQAKAMSDCKRCAIEARDGRSHAAEAAWQLLAPNAKEWMPQVLSCVSKAKAAKLVAKRRGEMSLATQDEFEYVRAVELELLQDRLAKYEGRSEPKAVHARHATK